jgi:hypothetical protein
MHLLYSVYYELPACTCFEHHLQEALHKQQLVYCVRVMSVGSYQDWRRTGVSDTISTPIVVCLAPPEDEYVVLETCRSCQFIIN